jgi:hypothetical protein
VIADGKYEVPREQGLPPGSYRVLISSPVEPAETDLKPEQLFERLKKEQGDPSEKDLGKKEPVKKDPGKKDTPKKNPGNAILPKDRIPAEFNSASTQKIEVRSGGKNVFDFTIP